MWKQSGSQHDCYGTGPKHGTVDQIGVGTTVMEHLMRGAGQLAEINSARAVSKDHSWFTPMLIKYKVATTCKRLAHVEDRHSTILVFRFAPKAFAF